ncbi:autotransporter assembly complex protein TamA [Ramlibacter rhizophilus]|uniref:Translocation and assembly module subunit TamA n=1 Tax=Ramlibacter rhizophilus TaxID=1781167 RepID=A0A4Z0BKZ8_9BURK|nr:BamA/TamA family outer membrane protein [Ramlibacter rhizophilus]TFY98774.1 outer membrane protein assembly factor [Ramlibacter rhizophilus]
MQYRVPGPSASAALRLLAAPLLAALLLMPLRLAAQAAPAPADPAAAPSAANAVEDEREAKAFDLEVRAPDELKELLEKHLSLQRFRDVPDLEDAEIERLVAVAETEVRQLVATQGYFAPVVEIRIERERQPTRVVVVVQPREAAQVEAVEIGFEGAVAQSSDPTAVAQRETIRDEWALPPGERFTQEAWSEAKEQALQVLLAKRYPLAKISYSLAAVNAGASRARLGLRLDSGPLVRLGEPVVIGAERYPKVIAERIARLAVGSVYDRQDIFDAQLRLTGSGYYDTAFIFVDSAQNPEAAPVQINVREADQHKWVLGVGLTTDLGPHASVEYRNNAWPTSYWLTKARLQIEKKAPVAEVELLSIPGEDGWRWGGLARASRLLDDDGLETRALRLRGGRSRLSDNIEREMYLQLDRASVRDTTGLPSVERGDGSAITANYNVTWRYFDSPTLPTRGWGVGVELGAGYTLTGERSPFQRTVLRGARYVPLESSRLLLRAETGAVFAADEAEIPSTSLFRTGGDTTVRGYGYREIGVTRANGVDAPGRYLVVGSIEWMRPIRRNDQPTNLEHTLFIDAGAVADEPGQLDPKLGIGTGVRYLSPIGALQASIAYGVDARRLRLHLSVGVVF